MQSLRLIVLLSCLLLSSSHSNAQNDAILLVIPNEDCKILLDGIEQGQTKAGSAFRVSTSAGEHYLEALSLTSQKTKGEIVQIESGKQKIVKLEFIIEADAKPMAFTSVAEINFNLPGTLTVLAWQSNNEGKVFPYPEFYYAFEKGDQIVLDATMSNKNGTNIIAISTYPDGVVRFSNNAFAELKELKINVHERSIYRFQFATNHTFDRNCFLKIRRQPGSMQTAAFNPSVSLKRILTPVPVHEPQDFFINGGLNATFSGGISRVTIPISLPENTVEWYYRFSASRNKSDVENIKSNFKLFAELSNLLLGLSGPGLLIGELGINKLTEPPGADYCKIYLLDTDYRAAFEAKADDQWRFYPEGSRDNFKSGNVKITAPNAGRYYLGILNPEPTFGVNVSLEVVAITEKQVYTMDY